MTLPLFFAWVNPTDTTWSSSFARMDEDIVHMKRTLREGQTPQLELTIRNPRRGLLSGLTWAWMAYNQNGTAVPWFFGRLQGLPNQIDQEVIRIILIARSEQWLLLKQTSAETLKGQDGHDPIFLDPALRDDPDALLEGFGAMFHYAHLPSGSPLDLQVTVSDLIDPEDGYATFQAPANNPLYDNVEFTIGQQPLVLAGCRASVQWTQRAAGTIDIGTYKFGQGGATTVVTAAATVMALSPTNFVQIGAGSSKTVTLFGSSGGGIWTGGSIIDSWPKSGAKLSGGYSVAAAFALGSGAQFGSPQSHTNKWENREASHIEGDTMSIDESWTTFPCGGKLIIYDLQQQIGIIDPFGSTTLQGPVGVNIPSHLTYSETLVCDWSGGMSLGLTLDYEAARPHTEALEFRLAADVQPVLADPNLPASQDMEIDVVPGSDVGMPIWNVLSWYTLFLQGGTVPLGQIVKSTPAWPGQPIFSICVVSGTVGTVEPTWDDVLGATVSDGSVTWASLGFNVPSDLPTWDDVAHSDVALGTVIRAQYFMTTPVDRLGIPFPAPAGGTLALQMCVQAGLTQYYTNSSFTGLADTQPQYPQPSFSATPGDTTADGSAIWVSLGDGSPVCEIPLGLNPGQSSYWSTDRAARSIRYLISRQRAKLRSRARQATIKFEVPFEEMMNLTCRMGAHFYDDRLPGGNALGKITETEIEMDAEQNLFIGRVEFRPCLGSGASVASASAVGDYGDYDYDNGQYQQVLGLSTTLTSGGDIFYSLPTAQPDADGLTFPILDKNQIIIKEAWINGRPPGAPAFVPDSYISFTTTTTYLGITSQTITYVAVPVGFTAVLIPKDYIVPYTGVHIATQTVQFFPITQYYLELKPLDGVSFAKQYNIETSTLMLPMGIDTEAPSLP